jgi:hypothetical protein
VYRVFGMVAAHMPRVKTALTTNGGRMASCFAGTQLWLVSPSQPTTDHQTIDTTRWEALAWGRELMRHDVSVLLCTGIDRFVAGSLQGHGIRVIAGVTGNAQSVLTDWRAGKLAMPEASPTWTASPDWRRACIGGCHGGRKRRREHRTRQ